MFQGLQYAEDVKVFVTIGNILLGLGLLAGPTCQASLAGKFQPGQPSRGPAAITAILAQPPFGYRPGYTDNVDDEVSGDPQEMLLVEKPAVLDGPSIHEKIFNDQLSREFIFKYQQQFGRTEQEENYFLINKQGYSNSGGVLTPTQEDDARRAFAEYMMKRLIEFHGENIMKTDPQLRKVYEIKQAVSNVNVSIGPSTRFDMTYGFVGNTAVGTFTNSVATVQAVVSMEPSSLVPTAPKEVNLSAHRALTRSLGGDMGYLFYDKAVRMAFTQTITPTMNANFVESVHVTGIQYDPSREWLSLFGFTVTF